MIESTPPPAPRPRFFVSCVSGEFAGLRTRVDQVLRYLGYDPESMDIWGTEGGDLRALLRSKIDECDGLVQIVGQGYGAEPPSVDADFGRVSYTQYEYLYAQAQGKRTWVIFAGEHCQRDKPIDELDLPRDHVADAAAYQAERQALQAAYRDRLRTSGALRHTASSDLELENQVLKLRDDTAELREAFRHWQQTLLDGQQSLLDGQQASDAAQRAERLRAWRLRAVTVSLLLVALLGIGWLVVNGDTPTVSSERVRVHLIEASEAAKAKDLAEARAVIGDWQRRQRLIDAAEAAHAQRLSRVDELANEFASIENSEEASEEFAEMTRILEEQGVSEALDYLESRRGSLIDRAKRALNDARQELRPLLSGAQLAIAEGRVEQAESLFEALLDPDMPNWPQARAEYAGFLMWTLGPREESHGTLVKAEAHYQHAYAQAERLLGR